MANVLVDETALQDIADAIRTKNGTENTYKPGQMADAIEAIPSGGITPTGTVNITQNGTTDVTQYASANVNVPNSYAAGDEGKVVSNGALVAQGSDTVTQNGTVDTTLIKSLTVNVPTGGGGATLISSEAVSGQQGKQINVSSSWFDTYDLVVIIPNITLSAQDWLYVVKDATTGGYYTNKNTSFGERYKTVLSKSASTAINYLFNGDRSPYYVAGNVNTYLYYYAYTSGVTMTGTFDIYGISL